MISANGKTSLRDAVSCAAYKGARSTFALRRYPTSTQSCRTLC